MRNRLRELIKQREIDSGEDIEIKQFALDTNISRQAIYKWLRGDADVYHKRAISAFCKYFGVGVGDLLIYEPDEPERETA